MRKAQLNIAGIILLFSLITPPVVTYSWLQYKKAIVKKEVKKHLKAGMEKKELVELQFSKKEVRQKLRWEHSREFEYKDQMYDVVEVRIQNDSFYYLCWWDRAESKIKHQLEGLIRHFMQKDPENNSQKERLFEFYKSLYCSSTAALTPLVHLQITTTYFHSDSYISPNLSPPVPPPQFL